MEIDRIGTYKPVTRLGGTIRQATEFIFKNGESYLVKFTPDANDAKVNINIEFYEVL